MGVCSVTSSGPVTLVVSGSLRLLVGLSRNFRVKIIVLIVAGFDHTQGKFHDLLSLCVMAPWKHDPHKQ